jgi:lysophospholipase L1-like esterase
MVEAPCKVDLSASPEVRAIIASIVSGRKYAVTPAALTDFVAARAAAPASDWPMLCVYKAANAQLASRPYAVFIGDSNTEYWSEVDSELFGRSVVGRGVGGQTSPQVLTRFYADVVALRPEVVHILVGTNDIGGNTGLTTAQDWKNNVMAMAELARAAKIRVVLASIPPVVAYPKHPEYRPRETIRTLNIWLATYAKEIGAAYVDYGAVLATTDGSARPELYFDGLHPNAAGYALMRPLALQAIGAPPKGER